MSKNKKYCEPSIARVYTETVRGSDVICRPPPVSLETRCISTKVCKHYDLRDPVLNCQLSAGMSLKYGLDLDPCLWVVHKRAKIGGVTFTSGEPITGVKRSSDDKMLRCGSVVTTVQRGKSLYAWVIRFLSFDTNHLAHVKWFPIPEYPFENNPIVALLRHGGPKPDLSCTLDLTEIDPSQVAILREGRNLYPMRLSGINVM